MIMLISIDAFYNIFSFEIQSYKSVEGQSVNWNLRKTNKKFVQQICGLSNSRIEK